MYPSPEQRRRRRREEGEEQGFTLVELLIVIVVLGILAGIVVFAVQSLTGSGARDSCSADFKNVQTALEVYKAQMGGYPEDPGTDSDGFSTPSLAVGLPPGGTNATALLLTGSESRTNPGHDAQGNATANNVSESGGPVGPWLKDEPDNTDHYQIYVSNDGKGIIVVLDGAGNVAGPTGGNGGNGASDCNDLS